MSNVRTTKKHTTWNPALNAQWDLTGLDTSHMAFVPALPAGHCWCTHLCSEGCEACSSGRALCWQQSHTGQGCGMSDCKLPEIATIATLQWALSRHRLAFAWPWQVLSAGSLVYVPGGRFHILHSLPTDVDSKTAELVPWCLQATLSNYAILRICKLFYLNHRHEEPFEHFFSHPR